MLLGLIAHLTGSALQETILESSRRLLQLGAVLLCDELGYLPVDKRGADLLFQIISARYERSSTIVTSNRVYKSWSEIFNNDSTLTSALLDRLLHHSETVLIEGRSFRAREMNQTPA